MTRRLPTTAVMAVLLVAWCRCAFALNPSLDIDQLIHTAWRVRDGFIKGTPQAIAQTSDGYIWLGTDSGLFRFDGVKVTAWRPPPGQALPSSNINSMLAARDGTLWIATNRGLVTWNGRTLTELPELNGQFIGKLLEDRDGTLWVTVASATAVRWTLCSVTHAKAQCYGQDGGPGANAFGLFEDRRGFLWVGTDDGIWRWKPGPRRFFRIDATPNGIQGLAQGDDDTLLVSTRGGIRRFDGETSRMAYASPLVQTGSAPLLRDRDGGLWIGTTNSGLLHVHKTVTDAFTAADGLSGNRIRKLFEDRESSVWALTPDGVDRFRDPPVATLSTKQGIPSPVMSLAPSADGAVWVAMADGLYRVRGSGLRVERVLAGESEPARVQSLFQDHRGRLWVSRFGNALVLEDGRFEVVPGISEGNTRAIAEDRDGVWFANQVLGLLRLSPDRRVERVPWPALGRGGWATAMAADPRQSGVWLAFTLGGIGLFSDGRMRALLGESEGVGGGAVRDLRLDADGALWAATDGGLTRVKDGRAATLTTRNGLPCDTIRWTLEDDSRSVWVSSTCGIARIGRSEIDKWIADADAHRAPAHLIVGPVFDIAEGARAAGLSSLTSDAVVASDGRLWFRSADGVSILDPHHLPINQLPPPVQIEEITADHNLFSSAIAAGRVFLPALTRDVQIDYTALSFVAPDKVQFRYKLEGFDRDWQDAGNRRQAFYTNLPPGNYRFRVTAANNSGVWNEAGASMDVSVVPAYYQTTWFMAFSVVAVVALAWSAHRIRVRIVERHESEISALNERLMKAQEQERIRIAGELHDGVMQEMLAMTMMLGTARRRIGGESPAAATIDKMQEKLIKVGADIRQLSHDLHPPMLQQAGLPNAVQAYCEQFSSTSGLPVACEADENARNLSRGAALALFRITQEALGNAAKHASAKHLAVHLTRTNGEVSLTVSDDGVGFDPGQLGASGGLGLIMMRERASQLDGTFEFDSAPGRGTTIRVVIPFR